MTDQTTDSNPLFMSLVLSLQAGAWQQLGKVASQMSGKVERDLQGAKYRIDLLGMLQEKTEGNLNEQEKQMLEHIVYELRMNFVDESKKAEPVAEPDAQESTTEANAEETEPTVEEKQAGDKE